MNEESSQFFRIITDGCGNYLIWESARRLPPAWEDTPHRGNVSELLALIRTLIVDTSPTPMVMTRKALDSAWQDTLR